MPCEWYCTEGCANKEACKYPKPPRKEGCVFAYDAANSEPQFRWMGEGPPPKRWWANGTLVYRSYSDYCD